MITPPPNKVIKGKLRNKIFLFMGLIGIVPLIAAAALTYYVVMNSHRDDVAKVETAVLTQTGNEVQSFLSNSILAHASVEIPYGGNIFSTSSIPAQQYVLSQTLGSFQFIQSEAYVNLSGIETAAADRSDISGVASSLLQDVSATPGFQAAKEGNNYLGPVTYAGGMPIISFASPVRDAGGNVIGVITGTASLEASQPVVASATIGSTGYLYLVDQNGTIIAGGGSFASAIGSSTVANFPIVQKVIGGTAALYGGRAAAV